MSLAMKLREGTSKNHDEAESVGFIKCFRKGVLERDTYVRHLEAFYAVYGAMESAMDANKTHPVVSKIYFPELYRTKMIEQDLAFYHGPDWKSKISTTEATQAYVNHIQKISKENPTLLVAHSYVRYLGDLSGGQILKKVAARALGLTGTEGVAFYEFPEITTPNEFKKMYREALDSLGLSESDQEAVLEEARKVFDLNKEIFLELEDDLIANIGKDRFDSILAAS
jgi:heme oxygenase